MDRAISCAEPPELQPVGSSEGHSYPLTSTTVLRANASAWWVVILAALLGLVVFLPTLGHGFIFDDEVELRGFDGLFTPGGWLQLLVREYGHLYRPLKSLTLHLDHLVWGLNPLGFHLTNVLLHAVVCALVAAALLALGRSRGAALAGAAWYALHPIHVEAVAWVTARGALLSALGVFAAVIAFANWRRTGRFGYLLLLALAAAFAFFSKEDSLLLVPALAALAWWGVPGERATAHRSHLGLALGATLLPALLYLGIRHALLPDVRQGTWEHGFVGLIATLPGILARYLGQLVCPLDLVLEPRIDYRAGFGMGFWLSSVLVLTCFVVPFLRGDRWPPAKLAVAWFLLFLLPALGFIPINAPAADRFLYTASFAGALLVAAGWESVTRIRPAATRSLAMGLSAVCLLLASQTVSYSAVWKNDLELWGHVVERNPDSYRGWTNLATQANNRRQFTQALQWTAQALELKPNYAEAFVASAYALDRTGRSSEAERAYRQALELSQNDPVTLYLLADLLERERRFQEAAKVYDLIFQKRPGYVEARVAAGIVAMRLGNPQAAISHWEAALRYDPRNQMARHNLSLARSSSEKTSGDAVSGAGGGIQPGRPGEAE